MTEPLSLEDIHQVRIHPAIGVARVGNSPDAFFIGPERPGTVPSPGAEGHYKDSQGRIKRQAARFRCFGFNQAGDRWRELSHHDGVRIQWTVHLVNKKACAETALTDGRWRNKAAGKESEPHDEAGCEALTIDPGYLEISGRSERGQPARGHIAFGGIPQPVVLGELRTDAEGHLLVLGGSGAAGSPADCKLDGFDSPGWWDDIADGPVQAHVHIAGRTTPLPVEAAWVMTAPPKYAPGLETVVTLWDRLQDLFTARGELDGYTPSYTRDIQPVLQRARHMNAVYGPAGGKHLGWPEPMYGFYHRRKIHSWLERGDQSKKLMPRMQVNPGLEEPRLTDRQLHMLDKWRDGDFHRDWDQRPREQALTPEGLDQAALEGCVGKAFFPGIEAGWFLLKTGHWAQPHRALRFAETVAAGDVTSRMCLPWHADFFHCDDEWWPVPRPNQVVPEGSENTYQAWTREWVPDAQAMTASWHQLGFVTPDPQGRYRERERHSPDLQLSPPACPADGQWTTTPAEPGRDGVWQAPEQLTGTDLACYGRGELPAGHEHRWPFLLTDEDHRVEITVRSRAVQNLTVRIRTPLAADVAEDDDHLITLAENGVLLVRLALPLEPLPGRTALAGRWYVCIGTSGTAADDIPYQVTVATEPHTEAGGTTVRRGPDGALTFNIPALDGAQVRTAVLVTHSGQETALRSASASGSHTADGTCAGSSAETVRLRLTGFSALGHPFVRERFLTISAPA
ncbi:LodA/GoxA family CTQ-dependent oxidase [Streptomyces syringium]|uniref:LodA/GoxA family CTQ-dependent oxidase n=1 Tax=Streptomyces syringium TaxID=76729 RepID=UPI003AAE727A